MIPGWSHDILPWQEEVATKFLPAGGTYLEVGVFLGASLSHMGELRPDIALIAVDPWEDEPSGATDGPSQGWAGPGIHAGLVKSYGGSWFGFLALMKERAPDVLRRTRVVRGTARTVRLLTPVDVLFVDAAHDYENVSKDLDAFAPLVRPGGIVAGHDFDPFSWPGVVRAVKERYGERVKRRESVWWVQA